MDSSPPKEGYLFTRISYRTVTPLHVGVGQDVGIVDLPVAREVATGYPFVPGSGLRGVLRDRAEALEARAAVGWSGLVDRLFGPWEGELTAGCVSVLDARLLLFPVRASAGVFRWLTCPFVLDRYRRDQEYFLGQAEAPPLAESAPDEGEYLGSGPDTLYLDEFPFTRGAAAWSWESPPAGVDGGRVVLVADEVFAHFARNATIVQQRNRLSTAKTVLKGALFSLEAVPPEAVFYGFLGAHRERRAEDAEQPKKAEEKPEPLAADDVRQRLREVACNGSDANRGHLVVGGGESVGMGLTELVWHGGA